LDLPSGPWGIRWIDPSTGSEMAQNEVVSETNGLELEMPAKSDHWIIHIERKTTLLTNRN
jgi:hypothetical protein